MKKKRRERGGVAAEESRFLNPLTGSKQRESQNRSEEKGGNLYNKVRGRRLTEQGLERELKQNGGRKRRGRLDGD